MPQFIELYRPLRPQIKAVKNGLALPWDGTVTNIRYDKYSVLRAYEYRKKMLDYYLEAVEGERCLNLEPRLDMEPDRQKAAAISHSYRGFVGCNGCQSRQRSIHGTGWWLCLCSRKLVGKRRCRGHTDGSAHGLPAIARHQKIYSQARRVDEGLSAGCRTKIECVCISQSHGVLHPQM